MKYIILGIKDYCKGCWHDWLVKRLSKLHPKIYFPCRWHEGGVWHYIRQRKIANNKKIKY